MRSDLAIAVGENAKPVAVRQKVQKERSTRYKLDEDKVKAILASPLSSRDLAAEYGLRRDDHKTNPAG